MVFIFLFFVICLIVFLHENKRYDELEEKHLREYHNTGNET